ncbi:KH domain-containing, RNA-binding, signal transduction-associated protein 3 [Lamellibrachia satsuma]|nr:KH domain-containing, RNA-binding, signal transduction-associated protein 3 [Lamellibrachia satsuma]
MANNSDYLQQLQTEKDNLDTSFVNAIRLISAEIQRVQTGGAVENKFTEVHRDFPQKITQQVLIPIKEFPKFNFVGKLLGPKGHTLKGLQEVTGTKMSILGKGSMRDKQKEDELRKEGGKHAHLNAELHVLVEAFAPPSEAHQRISHALMELKKFLVPEMNDDIQQQQYEEMLMMNGQPAVRGGGRGRGAPSRGMPSRGGAASLLPAPLGRGGSSGRGAPSRGGAAPRGSMLGGRGAPRGARGAPRGRGAPVPRPAPPPPKQDYSAPQAYEDDSYSYGAGAEAGYGEAPSYAGNGNNSYTEQSYGESYDQSGYAGAGGDTQYFEYGHGSSARSSGGQGGAAAQSYGDYGGDSWSSTPTSYGKAPPRTQKDYRQHPYGSGRGAQHY